MTRTGSVIFTFALSPQSSFLLQVNWLELIMISQAEVLGPQLLAGSTSGMPDIVFRAFGTKAGQLVDNVLGYG